MCDIIFWRFNIIRYHLQTIHNIFVDDDTDENSDYVTSEDEDVAFSQNMSKTQSGFESKSLKHFYNFLDLLF
jgi:hypothetical protein